MNDERTPLWRRPFFVMAVVFVMYAFKVFFKITVGQKINSPMITADGFHNIADLFEAAAVIFVIYLARRQPTQKYPFGRKQIEYLSSLTIGVALLVLAGNFALESIIGMLAYFPPADALVRGVVPILPPYQPLVMSIEALPWIIAVTAGSTLLSVIVSRYQITIGRESGHQSLIADGEETASDGRIEAVALIGVIGEYLFQAPWIEYPLALVIAVLVTRTAFGLMKGGWRALLLSNIGDEHEEEIRSTLSVIPGVVQVSDLKTFRVGHSAVCLITLITRASARKCEQIKYACEHRITRYLESQEFKGWEIQIKFESPAPDRHRVAFAITAGKYPVIADTLATASHLVVCDVEDERVLRPKRSAIDNDALAILASKRVRDLYVFKPDQEAATTHDVVKVKECPSYDLTVMGIPAF